jgi:hypothetical protein
MSFAAPRAGVVDLADVRRRRLLELLDKQPEAVERALGMLSADGTETVQPVTPSAEPSQAVGK